MDLYGASSDMSLTTIIRLRDNYRRPRLAPYEKYLLIYYKSIALGIRVIETMPRNWLLFAGLAAKAKAELTPQGYCPGSAAKPKVYGSNPFPQMSNVNPIVYVIDALKPSRKANAIFSPGYRYFASNLRYDTEYGAIAKRLSRALFNPTSLGTSAIPALYRYYKNSTGSAAMIGAYSGTLK